MKELHGQLEDDKSIKHNRQTFCAKHTFQKDIHLTFCGSESTVILYEYFDKCNDINYYKVLNLITSGNQQESYFQISLYH